MAKYRLTTCATSDIAKIAEFTIDAFGVIQARDYLDNLINTLQILSNNPKLGRAADELSNGLRRYEYKSHTIFYTHKRQEILIVRVLHQNMNYTQHLK